MKSKNDNGLFYTCSLIEYMGRSTKNRRGELVTQMGKETLQRIYDYSDVFHCEPIEKTAYEFIQICDIKTGSFDNVGDCNYNVPSYWDIGKVYERLIEDVLGEKNVIDVLFEVYNSFIDEYISDFNMDVYYQSREYIFACYDHKEIF